MVENDIIFYYLLNSNSLDYKFATIEGKNINSL